MNDSFLIQKEKLRKEMGRLFDGLIHKRTVFRNQSSPDHRCFYKTLHYQKSYTLSYKKQNTIKVTNLGQSRIF